MPRASHHEPRQDQEKMIELIFVLTMNWDSPRIALLVGTPSMSVLIIDVLLAILFSKNSYVSFDSSASNVAFRLTEINSKEYLEHHASMQATKQLKEETAANNAA